MSRPSLKIVIPQWVNVDGGWATCKVQMLFSGHHFIELEYLKLEHWDQNLLSPAIIPVYQ